MTRISEETIRILEEEGLGEALNELGAVMAGPDGYGKHGSQRWRSRPVATHHEKLIRHLAARRLDPDSGRQSMAHVIARGLFLLQLRLEETVREWRDITLDGYTSSDLMGQY